MIFGAGVSNTVNRGDYNTYTVYLPAPSASGLSSLTMEVCNTPTANSPTNVLNSGAMPAAYSTTATTAMFTSPTYNASAWVVGASPGTVTITNQVPGAYCDGTQKPAYDNALVTFANAKIMQCSNVVSVASQGGSKLTNYGVCQASSSPLSDVKNAAGVCTTCMWDKFSGYWITTDNGVTGIQVAGTYVRPWTSYQMSVGASLSITGILRYNGGWTLVPRDTNDFSGLTALSSSQALPTVVIGDQTTGIKQQTYRWASPGPTLATVPYDPNGVTAAANLPLGMPPRILGPADVIQNGSTTLYGTGVFYCQAGGADTTCAYSTPAYAGSGAAPGQPGWVPDWNGCPNASAFAWVYSTNGGATTQNMCACYPPRYYSPSLGPNGAGTTYVSVTGIVSFVEGSNPLTGISSFYMNSGSGVNQALFVYQDAAAGVKVNLGDNVTIQAIAYSYYGLVEMQNTLSVKINSRGNAVPAPIDLYSLADLDVASQGHCAAQTVLYRANKVTVHNVTVSKVFMFEPYPYRYPGTSQSVQHWYNGTMVGTAYVPTYSPYYSQLGSPSGTALFNSTIASTVSNWYNSAICKYYGPTGSSITPNHNLTNAPFICGFEVTDGKGNYLVVDQAQYGTNGGLMSAFLGSDNVIRPSPITNPDGTVTPACLTPPCPLMVGDTFLTISGVLKYNRGGTSRELSAGGVLQLVPFGATGDGNPAGSVPPLTGRNTPITTVATVSLTYQTTITGSITAAQVNSNVALSTAIRTSIANTLNPPIPLSSVTITSVSRRRALLDTSITYVITVPAAQATSISSQVTSSAFQGAMATAVVSSVNGANVPGVQATGVSSSVYISGLSTTTDNKKVIAIGVGVGVGGGCGLIIVLGLVYKFVLKKKNIEQGQKSAVMMTPAGASA